MIHRRPRSSSAAPLPINADADFDEEGLTLEAIAIVADNSHTQSASKLSSSPILLLRHHVSSAYRKQRASVLNAIAFIIGIICLCMLQLHAVVQEYQGPLDHVTTSLLVPYYGRYCPEFSFDEGLANNDRNDQTHHHNHVTSWDCKRRVIQGNDAADNSEGNKSSKFPHIFMIGARDRDEDTFSLWVDALQLNTTTDGSTSSQHTPHLERINTLKMSNQFALSGGIHKQTIASRTGHVSAPNKPNNQYMCRKMKWEQRLFAVYQSVFHNLLETYPEHHGFVIIEDDAILANAQAFVHEVCNAHLRQLDFYSLYRSPLQSKGRKSSSCIYQHGTVAFYMRRIMMEKIVNERRRGTFCRFPIDMYISRLGPWYATRQEVVGHLGTGRIGST